jgi:hypothetical protein
VRTGILRVLWFTTIPGPPGRALAAKTSFGQPGCRSTPKKCILVGRSCYCDQNSRILSGTFQATCVLKGVSWPKRAGLTQSGFRGKIQMRLIRSYMRYA